jgi:hypothetical protein
VGVAQQSISEFKASAFFYSLRLVEPITFRLAGVGNTNVTGQPHWLPCPPCHPASPTQFCQLAPLTYNICLSVGSFLGGDEHILYRVSCDLLYQNAIAMSRLYNNIHPTESSYQLKVLSPVKRKPLATPRPIPSSFPKENAEESISLVQAGSFEEPVYGSKWMSSDGWMMEIISQLLSILCLVSVIAVLAKFNGSLLESWTSPVSPNAVIAVLSTAAKTAMILPVAQAISQLKWLHFKAEGRR